MATERAYLLACGRYAPEDLHYLLRVTLGAQDSLMPGERLAVHRVPVTDGAFAECLAEGRYQGCLLGGEIPPAWCQRLDQAGIAWVLASAPAQPDPPPAGTPWVHNDLETGYYLATQHLIALGHRRIALIGADGDPATWFIP